MSSPYRRSITALILVTLSTALLVACSSAKSSTTSASNAPGNAAASGAGKTIAMLLPNTASIRFTKIDGPVFKATVTQLCPSCTVIVDNANGDASTQQAQAEAAMTQGARVLVLDPFDGSALAGVVAEAKAKNIPVIDYDSLITNAPISYYVSFDGIRVGQLIAQSLVDRMKQLGTTNKCVVAIRGDATDTNQAEFWKGSLPVLQQAHLKICYNSTTPGWASAPAQQEMDQAITQIGKSNIGGVYVMNDSMAAGVAASLVNANFATPPPITGQDGDTAAIQRILIGQQYMTVWKDTTKLAQTAAQMAVDLANGKTPATTTTTNNGAVTVPAILLSPVAVTINNIKSTVVAAGFVTPAELCTGQYAAACVKVGLH
jgi:D-xylose transport system substrate-binding protein